MPSLDTCPDGRDAELRNAVKRLMAFRDRVLKFPADITHRENRLPLRIAGNTSNSMIRLLMDDPAWHTVEELLRQT